MSVNYTDSVYVFTTAAVGVTSTRTSNPQDVSKRDSITLVFTSSGISSGNGVFTIDASNDNSYWVTGISFRSASATGAAFTQGTNTITSSTNRNYGAILDPAGWSYIRIKVAVTTDGRYNAILHSQG